MFPAENSGCLPRGHEWTNEQQVHIKNYIIESFAQFRKTDMKSNEGGGGDLKPNTIAPYVRNIQRGFGMYWGYNVKLLVGPIFNHPKNGFKTVLHNKSRDIQTKGIVTKGHKILSDEDVMKIHTSSYMRGGHPLGFR